MRYNLNISSLVNKYSFALWWPQLDPVNSTEDAPVYVPVDLTGSRGEMRIGEANGRTGVMTLATDRPVATDGTGIVIGTETLTAYLHSKDSLTDTQVTVPANHYLLFTLGTTHLSLLAGRVLQYQAYSDVTAAFPLEGSLNVSPIIPEVPNF